MIIIKINNQEEALTTMGLKMDASYQDAKKQHIALSWKYHPDRKNGDEEKFKIVEDAWGYLKRHKNLFTNENEMTSQKILEEAIRHSNEIIEKTPLNIAKGLWGGFHQL